MFPPADGHLQEGEGVDFRLPLDAQVFDPVIDADEPEADIRILDIQGDDGPVIRVLEVHPEGISVAGDPVGRENLGLGRENEEILIVIRPFLGEGAEGDAPPVETFLPIHPQAGRRPVLLQFQPEGAVLEYDAPFPGDAREGGAQQSGGQYPCENGLVHVSLSSLAVCAA